MKRKAAAAFVLPCVNTRTYTLFCSEQGRREALQPIQERPSSGLGERTSRVHRKEQEPSVTTGGAEDSLLCSTCVRNASAMCRLCTTRRIALS